jgi:hypothetical protein
MAFTTGNDVNILQATDSSFVGAGAGNDKYILSATGLTAGQTVNITDADGTNTLQLIGGLTIASSKATSNALQLTLSNGAIVNVLGANTFSFEIGGDPFGVGGTIQNFSTFVVTSLGMDAVPTSTSAATSGATNVGVNSNGTTTVGGPVVTTPTFSVTASAASADEGNSATFNVDLAGRATGVAYTVTVTPASVGTASTPADYAALDLDAASKAAGFTYTGGVLTVPSTIAGTTAQAVFTTLVATDALTETGEGVSLTLSAPTAASGTAAVLDAAKTAVTTTFADVVAYTLTAAATSVNEGNAATFNIVTDVSQAGKTVAYTLSGTGITTADVVGGLTGTALIGADGKATVNIAVVSDATTESVAETLVMTLDGKGKTASIAINDTSVGPDASFYLTKNQDIQTSNKFFGSQTIFNVDGVGPTLNTGDFLTGTAGRTDNQLTITDLTPGSQNGNIPAGVTLVNIQKVILNTSGNTAGGTGFSTIGYDGVLTLNATTNGGSSDIVAAKSGEGGTAITVTRNDTGTGALTIIGGTDVTATNVSASSTGTIKVGQAVSGANTSPTGAVKINNAGTGAITSYGGTTQTVDAAGGDVIVGDDTGVAAKTSGKITVTNKAAITSGNTGNIGANKDVSVFGGADVAITTNAGDVVVGSASNTAVNPTGNITVTDTVGTSAAVAAGVAAGLAAGAAGTAAYQKAFNTAYVGAAKQSTVETYGGVDVTASTSGSVTVKGATGKVAVSNTDASSASTVTVTTGTDITVTTSGLGAVAIGSNAVTNPTGGINVTDTGGTGAISVKGGSSVTVAAKGNAVTIGGAAAVSTLGAVAVTQNAKGAVTVDGGSTVAITSAGGAIKVGETTTATGDVTVTDTYSGPNADTIAVYQAKGAVTINTSTATSGATTSGAITVGEAPTLNAGGTALDKGANNATGTVTIDNSKAKFTIAGAADTAYGTGANTVYTNGSTTVSVKGGTTGGTTITDVNTVNATSGAGAGAPVAASKLTTVTLNNAGATGITSNVLATVNITNATSSTTTITNTTAAHPLAVVLGNNAITATLQAAVVDTVVDAKAGVVTVTTDGTVGSNLVLTAAAATGLVFNNAAAVNLNTLTAPLLSTINASGATGAVTLTVPATVTYTGGTGASTVTVAADPLLTIAAGSGTADEYKTSGYAFVANSKITGFEILTADTAGTNIGTGFAKLQVKTNAAVDFTAVGAGTELTKNPTAAAAISYALSTDTTTDALTLNLAGTSSASTTGTVTATKIETVTVNSTGTFTTGNAVTLADTTLKSVVVKGSQAVDITGGDATQVRTITIAGNTVANDTVSATINGITSTSAALTTALAGTAPALAATALALAITTTGTAGVSAVASGNKVIITNTSAFSLSEAFTATGGGVVTISDSATSVGLATVDASAATGAVTVNTASVLAQGGVTVTGGSAALTAGGVTVANNGNPVKTVAVTGTVNALDTNTVTINAIKANGDVQTLTFTNVATPATPAAMATALQAGLAALGGYAASGVTVADGGNGVLTITAGAGVQISSVTTTKVVETVPGNSTLTVATTKDLYAATDVFTTGSGGGTITVGQGGHASYSVNTVNSAGVSAAQTPAVTFASGSETINLANSKSAVDTVVQVSGGIGRVNDFQVTTAKTTSDKLTFSAGATALANVTLSTQLNQTIVPGLNYTASNGVITFIPTGVHVISEYSVTALIAAVQTVLVAAGANKVAAFQSGSNTYVIEDPATTAVSVTILNGVTGITGFTGAGTAVAIDGGIAAQNTVVATNLTNVTNPVSVSSAGASLTTDATGYSVQAIIGGGTGGLQTITNLASSAQINDSSTGTGETLNITQVGTAGGNSLVYNSTGAHTLATMTLTGNTSLVVAADATTTISAIVDGGATNTLKTIYITDDAALTLSSITSTALTTIDASAHTGATTVTIVDNYNAQTIKAATTASTTVITANGNGNTISQASGTGIVTITANGSADTITVLSTVAGNTITATGSNDVITIGSGGYTINGGQTAIGSGQTISVSSSVTQTVANAITVGPTAVVTLGTADIDDTVTLISSAKTGTTSSGAYNFTTIKNFAANNAAAGSDKVVFSNAAVWLDATGANTGALNVVNVSAATTLAQALDTAASKAAAAGQPAVGVADWFQYGGDTYVVEVTGADHPATGLAATDFVVKLVGLHDLSNATLVAGTLTQVA